MITQPVHRLSLHFITLDTGKTTRDLHVTSNPDPADDDTSDLVSGQYEIDRLLPATDYVIKIALRNAVGTSMYSNIIAATTLIDGEYSWLYSRTCKYSRVL